ncbi:PfkB family carbohydrate kinase [candidate division NPL-UPA2 bacterium]|nr:PfkB family carbohydrate kinase [candidate division NPL-UPA2 bacterium]
MNPLRSSPKGTILVVGSVALDTVETPFGKAEEVLGGSATYFAYSASYFCEVNLVGIVGTDFPSEHLELLKSRGVDLRGLERKEGKTFRWKARYGEDPNERETLSLCLNVFENFHPKLLEDYRSSEYVFLANIDPDLHLEILEQLSGSKLIACDTMNIWIETKKEILLETLGKVDALILNDAETRMLTGEMNLIRAGKSILDLGLKIVVIKKGEHGALLFSEGSYFASPAYPVESIYDPTGAGDSFAGGFLGYLAKNGNEEEENLRKAIVYGSVMASYTVEGFSFNRLKSLTEADLEQRYQEFKKLTQF